MAECKAPQLDAPATRCDLHNDAEDHHPQYLSDSKNPNGYCNHGPNGLTCPVGVARVPSDLH